MADKNYPSGSGITAVEAAGLDANDFVFLGCSIAGAAQKTQYSELALAFGGSRRNLLINAQGAVNRRAYVSGTATSTGNEYALDRWRVITSGEALSFSDTAGKRTMTAPAGGLEQVIEGTWLQSGTYCISWEGTAGCTVGGSARTNGEAFSVTGGSNLAVAFGDGTVANPQLEIGEVRTPFDWRWPELEKIICQFFFERIGVNATNFFFGNACFLSADTVYGLLQYSRKRIIPTITVIGGNAMKALQCTSSGFNTLTTSAISPQYANIDSAILAITVSGGTAGSPGMLFSESDSYYFEVDAEIH